MPVDGRFIWVDIETFGLDTAGDYVLEVGFKITDLELEVIDDFQEVIWDTPLYDLRMDQMYYNPKDSYVLNMHKQSGLFEDASVNGMSLANFEERLSTWLEGHGIRDGQEPLCGSSVQFDRERLTFWWPKVMERFHYRNVDISSFKEVLVGLNGGGPLIGQPKGRKIHRVLPDIEDTIGEFSFYLGHMGL